MHRKFSCQQDTKEYGLLGTSLSRGGVDICFFLNYSLRGVETRRKHGTKKGQEKMTKDIVKLLVLLVVVGAIIFGLYVLGKSVDNQSKYQHPITRPGASW